MIDPSRLIFIHGLEGTSQGTKATLLRGYFPGMLTPDFHGSLDERMAVLNKILGGKTGWKLIGSSLGGLMAAIFTCQHPEAVDQLVLLAPALILPQFAETNPQPVSVPTVVYHGKQDTVVLLEPTLILAKQVFTNLTYNIVEDDHGLYQTVHKIDWNQLLT